MAATSDGRLLEAGLKPKFNALYYTVRDVRANRQRQGLTDDSPRLNSLESRLTGLVKTLAGTCANKLIASYPRHVFVVEDLDLRGCRGQKRFAYRALHHSLEAKASTEVVNPAYTSQTCPNCGFVSRRNRNGIKFQCCYCGKISHADVVGGSGLLRRSEDKQIGLADYPDVVKPIWKHDTWRGRNSKPLSVPWDGRKKRSNRRARSLLPRYRVFPGSAQPRTGVGKELVDETDSYHFGERLMTQEQKDRLFRARWDREEAARAGEAAEMADVADSVRSTMID